MIFHENCLLADNSHEIWYLISFKNLGNMSQNLSSAAVMICALRVNFEKHMTTKHEKLPSMQRDKSLLYTYKLYIF